MTKSEEDLEAQRRQQAQGQTGAATSQGPETTTTPETEAQGVIPPYDRPDPPEGEAAGEEGVHKSFRSDEFGGEARSAPPISQEERDAPSPTDTTAATPMGVGESTTASGEEETVDDKEAGRQDTGTEGKTGRPTGTSTGRDVTGVNPSGSGPMQSDAT